MKTILGISAYFHDSSACLIQDDKLIAAALEERFSRIKHDSSLPKKAIEFCLSEAGISIQDVDEVVFFEKPFTKFERIIDNCIKVAPFGFSLFNKTIRSWIGEKFWIEDNFKKSFDFKGDFSYCQHHLSHAAHGIYLSEASEGAYLIIDGVGENACTSFGTFKNGVIHPIQEQRYPHSIGLLYSAFTQYCGFKVNSGEYKLMGLAPYGNPIYKDLIYDNFVSVSETAEVSLNLKNFGFTRGNKMVNRSFEQVFSKPSRQSESEMTQFYKDIAASIQLVCEELVLILANYVAEITKQDILVYGGGVAMNCVANAQIVQKSEFKRVEIQSAAGDGGCAVGAALWRNGKVISTGEKEFLGPGFSSNGIEKALSDFKGIRFELLEEKEIIDRTAELLSENKVVGWFQGRMEFGARALGNRSILANPQDENMKLTLNMKIKKREGFRPFAPIILENEFHDYFEGEGNDYSKMMFVTRGKTKAKEIASCIHEDNSARVQSVSKNSNSKLHRLLEEFKLLTKSPVLINTSFNERGEPIVCTPTDAINCFFNTGMDALVMENYILLKSENQNIVTSKTSFELD